MTRTSRLAFGFVMMAGVIVLGQNALEGPGLERWLAPPTGHHWHAWQLIVGTWTAATIAALLGLFVPDRDDRWRVASYVVPSVGVALILPLTIHMPVVLYTKGATAFDDWVVYSGIFVLCAHIAFAAMVGARAKAIVEGRDPMPVHSIYGITVAMSCVPGLIIFIPVMLTALTGIPIIPLLFLMERWGKTARHEAGVPVAVARFAA